MRISSASMREAGEVGSVIGLLAHIDLGGVGVIRAVSAQDLTLAQSVTERDALVEHEALAAPKTLRLGNLFQIFQDAALEMLDLL